MTANTTNPKIPGTSQLVDLQGTIDAPHSADANKRDVVLLPSPSEDPNDPLNWTRWRKILSTICMVAYTLTVSIAAAAISSILEPISKDTELTLGDLNAGTGYLFLAFGWGCLVWQPLAVQYGKRPVFLISTLATSMLSVWAGHVRTNGQWVANKVLQGFFGAPVESLCEIWMTDIYFQHERGAYIALYGMFLNGSGYFAPLISGFITEGQGWQWVLYWCAIFTAVCFVFLFFAMEETNYPGRKTTAADATSISTSPEKGLHGGSDLSGRLNDSESQSEGERGPGVTRVKSLWKKMSLVDKRSLDQPNRLFEMVRRPVTLLTFPVIFWCGFTYGTNLCWFNLINGSTSLVFTEAPYEFSPAFVGLTYISPVIGTVLSNIYAGWFGDRFTLWMARRNNGNLESEYRLWLFAPCMLLIPGGLILYGVGAAHSVHWFGVVFAMGLLAATNGIIVQLTISYCVDSYYALSAEAIVTMMLVRNTMSFAFGYGLTPWITNMGLQNSFIVAAFAGLAQIATVFLFLKYGKGLRVASMPRYDKYVAQLQKAGLIH